MILLITISAIIAIAIKVMSNLLESTLNFNEED